MFDWVGLPAATAWGWVLQPSAGYIGQGMIMGPKTAWSMMAGAITGGRKGNRPGAAEVEMGGGGKQILCLWMCYKWIFHRDGTVHTMST